MLNFSEMEIKFGGAVAYQYLVEIEKAAGIASHQMSMMDPETRLAHALRVQDNGHDALIQAA